MMSEPTSFTRPPKRDVSRTRRYVVACVACIVFLAVSLAATLIFLHRTSVGSKKFIRNTFTLYTATFLVVLALLILATVLGRNLIKLYFERKSGQLGSGFKTKMVSTFIGLSLLPALLLFVLAYTLISSSIEQWFLAPPAQMMENSRLLAQQYYAEMEEQAKFFGSNIAGAIHSAEDFSPQLRLKLQIRLQEFSRLYGLGSVRIFDIRSLPVVESGPAISSSEHRQSIQRLIGQALLGEQSFLVERVTPKDPVNEITLVAVPIRDLRGSIIGAVLTEQLGLTAQNTAYIPLKRRMKNSCSCSRKNRQSFPTHF